MYYKFIDNTIITVFFSFFIYYFVLICNRKKKINTEYVYMYSLLTSLIVILLYNIFKNK